VRIVPALRAEDGLACSAEATALSGRDRRVAGRFASALAEVAREVRAGAAPREACLFVRDALAAQGVQGLDYVEVRHAGTLAPVADCALAGPTRVFGAARIAGLRLVDTVAVA
jgi:pantoate--beta-alanine ligase